MNPLKPSPGVHCFGMARLRLYFTRIPPASQRISLVLVSRISLYILYRSFIYPYSPFSFCSRQKQIADPLYPAVRCPTLNTVSSCQLYPPVRI